jgi:hypothetical protein
VTSGGATVTQNFLVVSTETKNEAFNHNPSPIVAIYKKKALLIHSKGCYTMQNTYFDANKC